MFQAEDTLVGGTLRWALAQLVENRLEYSEGGEISNEVEKEISQILEEVKEFCFILCDGNLLEDFQVGSG